MTDHYEALHEKSKREQAKAMRAYAMASAGPLGLIGGLSPRAMAVFLALVIAAAVFMFYAMDEERARRTAENEAWYQAKLECRKSGGSFEYFGTQGYHCIGGKQ